MSAGVDVLAVMDAGIARIAATYGGSAPSPLAAQLTEARAAVSALIAERDALREVQAEWAQAMALCDKAPKLDREKIMGRVTIRHYAALKDKP